MHLTHKPWTHYSYTVKPLYTGLSLHRTPFTQDSLYTGPLYTGLSLHRTLTTQDSLYTGLSLNQTPSIPESPIYLTLCPVVPSLLIPM